MLERVASGPFGCPETNDVTRGTRGDHFENYAEQPQHRSALLQARNGTEFYHGTVSCYDERVALDGGLNCLGWLWQG